MDIDDIRTILLKLLKEINIPFKFEDISYNSEFTKLAASISIGDSDGLLTPEVPL